MDTTFFGEFTMRMDDKGRVQVPAEFRRTLSAADPDRADTENPVVYILFGNTTVPWFECHSAASMKRVLARVEAMPASHPRKAAFKIYYSAKVEQVRLDDAGRLVLKKSLRERIALGRDVKFMSNLETFRLMSAEVPVEVADPLDALLAELGPAADLDAELPDA
ncbi:hypothetical protein JQC91_11715 [Jannaschia sp. Os4]|uniref:division/cell wall cluster transcriptional repressor MraZ n=1 Tax=Jannaschia sp. Os4 TaxID=2807617 RepID=UPI0019394F31|nr:hypothetical protein [Jannaschia sp. Os4]MBM2576966.1 hypothetical protein [Jannaschia sp. Os4]